MYDEFERAMTGRSSGTGMSVLGWLAAGFGFVFLVGLVGIGFALNRVAHKAEDFARNFDVGNGLAGLAMLADLESQTELIGMDPDRGLEFLRSLEPGDPTEAFMGEMVRGTFDLTRLGPIPPVPPTPPTPLTPPTPPTPPAVGPDGSLSVHGDEGDVHIDLNRSEGGGSLVINADGEQVRFDLVRTGSGGFLTIDSEDGQTRIDLVGTGEGGYLAINSDEGNVRFDLTKGEDGGQLVIRTDDETVRLGVGDEAQAMPEWVPRLDGMPERPRPVYSLESHEGLLGAVSWSGEASPSDILSFYRSELEAQGYDLRDDYRRTESDVEEAAFWARSEVDHRVVFAVVHRENGETKVLLGFAEGH